MEYVIKSGGGNVTDIAGAEIIAQTVRSIVGDPAMESGLNTVGLEVKEMTTQIVGELVDSLEVMRNVPNPSSLLPTIKAVTNTIGALFDVRRKKTMCWNCTRIYYVHTSSSDRNSNSYNRKSKTMPEDQAVWIWTSCMETCPMCAGASRPLTWSRANPPANLDTTPELRLETVS